MKKLFTLLLVVVMVLVLGACTSTTNPGTTDTSIGTTTGTTSSTGSTGTTGATGAITGDNIVTKEGFTIKVATPSEAENYTKLYEVNEMTGDDHLIIYGNSIMTNLKVTSGTYDNSTFTDGKVVHEEKLVTPGEGVLLNTTLPESGGNIKVTFTNASGKVMNYVITRNNGKLDAVAL